MGVVSRRIALELLSSCQPPPRGSFRQMAGDLHSERRDRFCEPATPRQARRDEQLRPEWEHNLWTQIDLSHLFQCHRVATAFATAVEDKNIAMRCVAFAER